MKKYAVFAASLFAICFASAASALQPVALKDQKPLFLYIGTKGDGGYNYMHEQGRLGMERLNPGIKSTFFENAGEDQRTEKALDAAINAGTRVVFVNSFSLMDFVFSAAKKYPSIIFVHCSGYKASKNLGTYFGRAYQPRYLSGLVAGKATKTNRIGYIAAYPIPEVIRGINAFTIGARKANPKAVVKVVWTYSWSDKKSEIAAVKSLQAAKCDTLAMHVDSDFAPKAAEKAGMWVVGYNHSMAKTAPTRHLVSVVWDWEKYYSMAVRSIAVGSWKPNQIWLGMDSEVVRLSEYGGAVSAETKTLVEAERKKMAAGTFDVFTGPL
ncbi:MAG: BMP family ABC transporter substrate-binding protein, partial [Synergistaceae bacterium]|nr:BMP family ABC transporter substrate-binding protein [Synergistaceae bacterium]